MRKGVSFTLTVVVVGMILLITAITVILGSGEVLGDYFGTVSTQTDERGQELGSTGDTGSTGLDGGGGDGDDGGDGGGGGDEYPYYQEDAAVSYSEVDRCCPDDEGEGTKPCFKAICSNLKITEGGYDCVGDLKENNDGDVMTLGELEVGDGEYYGWNFEEEAVERKTCPE